MSNLTYVSEAVVDRLYANVEHNLERYRETGFAGLMDQGEWSIPLPSVQMDPGFPAALDPSGGNEAEIANSLRVWKALRGLTAMLATENRIWTRLAHVECLDYARHRWLDGIATDDLPKRIRTHFFASTRNQYRDDNAVSRLWWNAFIAHTAFPEDPPPALREILKTADIRLNFVERPWISTRTCVASGLLRLMMRNPTVTAPASTFRNLMKSVNIMGAGIVFETMSTQQVDEFMDRCAVRTESTS